MKEFEDFQDFPSLGASKKPDPEEVYVPDYVPVALDTLNLESEFLVQYNSARKLLHDASYDPEISLNQKASLINSITSIINALVKGQQELYSIERVKKIEGCLLRTLKEFPELQSSFMEKYKESLSD